MSDPAGTSGLTRLLVLKDSATLFANLIQKNNGIGLIPFDDDAYAPNDATYGGMFITKVNSDAFGDATKNTARTQIALQGAHGNTSIGDGIAMGKIQLDAIAPGTYDGKAMIVFTDGLQNRPQSIEDVASSITNKTFAIGLGSETQVNTLELNNITRGSGGYLLLSGLISSSIDDSYRMQKFFMQILANVTNTQIVKDPLGYINTGNKIEIPFNLCTPDINCRVITLTQYPFVKLMVEAPDGQIITPANAASYNAAFETNNHDTVICSFGLPVLKGATKNHSETWYAILEVDAALYIRILSINEKSSQEIKIKGSKYCVSIHAYSNLKMEVRLNQSGLEPGDLMTLRAAITEYLVPLQRAKLVAQITNPDHTVTTLALNETEPGIYTGSRIASMSGIYHFHIIATGLIIKESPLLENKYLTVRFFLVGIVPVHLFLVHLICAD